MIENEESEEFTNLYGIIVARPREYITKENGFNIFKLYK